MAISVKQAAERMGNITPQSVREAIERGDLRAEKVFDPTRPLVRPRYEIGEEDFAAYLLERAKGKKPSSGRSTKEVAERMALEGYRTLAEAARMVGTSTGELRRLIRLGRVRARREGVFFIHDDDIGAIMERRAGAQRKMMEAAR